MIKVSKCVLLYATIICSILLITGADAIMSVGIKYFLIFGLVCVALIYLSYKLISKKEFDSFTGFKIIDKL